MTVYKTFREKKYGEAFDRNNYVWPKDKNKRDAHPILGGLEDIDDMSMEYPSPIKVNQDIIESKLAELEQMLDKKSEKKQ